MPEEHRQALEVIYRAAQREVALVNDLLDMARIESGKLRIDPQPGRVSEVLAESKETMIGYAGDRRSAIDVMVPENEPEMLFDKARILQVVNNLLSNAIKFTEPGTRIELGLAVIDGHGVTVYVKDRGPGIPPDEIPQLFDKFTQGRTKARNGRLGSGLGLAISKHIIELHKGRIWVESEVDAGSTLLLLATLRPAGPVARYRRPGYPQAATRARQ